jgi:hypothetical protein
MIILAAIYLAICGLATALVGPKFGLGLLVGWLICVALAVMI